MSNQAPFSTYREAGDLLFFAGQIELLPGPKILEGTISEKTDQAMKNVKALLDEVGLTFSDIVMSTIYLTDMKDYAEMNEAYGKWFSDVFPARVAVAVKELPLGAKVEIVVVASKTI